MADTGAHQPGPADENPRWTGIAQLIELAGKGKLEPLPAERLLPLCPDESWCGAVDGDMAGQLRGLNGRLAAMAADRDRTFAAAHNFVESDPEFTRSLLQGFVRNWSQRLSGVREEGVDDNVVMVSGPGGSFGPSFMPQPNSQSSTGGIPLTRARRGAQPGGVRGTVRGNREAGAAWTKTCWSPPSRLVIPRRRSTGRKTSSRRSDRSTNCGPPSLGVWRRPFASSWPSKWRQPEVQEQMNTRRTDKEQVAEVQRINWPCTRRLLRRKIRARDSLPAWCWLRPISIRRNSSMARRPNWRPTRTCRPGVCHVSPGGRIVRRLRAGPGAGRPLGRGLPALVPIVARRRATWPT